MDYTLGCDDYGRFFAEFSMGHEALGTWLASELGSDHPALRTVLEAIERLQQGRIWEYEHLGREYGLYLSPDEALVRAHALGHPGDGEAPEDLSLYDDELEAGCGLDDFKAVLLDWRALIGG